MRSRVADWLGFSSKDEFNKFFLLSTIFSLIIGVYWFLRPLKDSVFMTVVGGNYIPMAKFLSLIVVFPLVIIYSKLVDILPRHKLFYILATLYGIMALGFAVLMATPGIGMANAVASPYRFWGWAWYVYVESFGSLLPILFWAFAADTTMPDVAKRGFPFISFIAQFGVLLGCSINAGRFGVFSITTTLLGSAVAMVMIALMVYIFMQSVSVDQLKSYNSGAADKKGKKASFMDAFRLMFSQPYLLGILFSIVIYEVLNTLFDFKFKTLVAEAVQRYIIDNNIAVDQIGAIKTQMFNQWTGSMGEWMSILGIVAYLLGLGKMYRQNSAEFSNFRWPWWAAFGRHNHM